MFYRAESDQYIQEGVPFEIDETQYPSNWLNLSTPEEKEALGLQEVITVGERKDDRYYWVSEKLEGANLVITNTPKDFDGVQKSALNALKQQAYALLLPSDWMITRKAETGIDLPVEWSSYRDNVRLEVNVIKSQIENAKTVDDIAGIITNWPVSPDAQIASN